MARIDVTETELLAALAEAEASDAGPDDAFTVAELAERTGVSVLAMRARIGALVRAGRVESVRVTRPAMDGRAARVPAYRLATERAA